MPHLTNEPKTNLQLAIENAAWQRAEVQRFETSWRPLQAGTGPMPLFSWAELERQLSDLSPHQSQTAGTLVSAIRKQSKFKPSEMVLREVLIAASVLMDEGPQSGWSEDGQEDCETGEGAMT